MKPQHTVHSTHSTQHTAHAHTQRTQCTQHMCDTNNTSTTATQHHTHTNYMPTCCSTRTWHTWHQCRSHYNTARLWVAISGPPSAAVTAAAVTAAAVMHRCHLHLCHRCRPRCSRTFSCAPTAAPWPGAAPQRWHGEQLWQWGGAVPVAGWAAAAQGGGSGKSGARFGTGTCEIGGGAKVSPSGAALRQ